MIEVKHLTKKYGSHVAVSDLSFTIEQGKVYGFLGPNGAGKSTTMNIITGCLGATEGEVFIDGHSIFEEPLAAKKNIGYLPEMPPLYNDMTVTEYLRFVAAAKKIPKNKRAEQISDVIAATGLADMRMRMIHNLSKGYRQRVGLAQALLGDPEVIILDEPTVGLDPAQIIEIRELVRKLGEKHTVILSSHILSEVSAVCDSIMIISHGTLVASDTPENLEHLSAGADTVTLEVKGSEEDCKAALAELDIGPIACERIDDAVTCVTVRPPKDTDVREALFRAFAKADHPILEMRRAHASLEDIFLELTKDESKEADAQ